MKTKEQKIKELTKFRCPIKDSEECKHLIGLLKKHFDVVVESYNYNKELCFFAIWEKTGLLNKYKAGSIMVGCPIYCCTSEISYEEMEKKIQNLSETINIELTPQEVVFIERIVNIKDPLKELVHQTYQQTEKSMIDYFFGAKNKHHPRELWNKFAEVKKEIKDVKDLFKEEENIFTFSNGLKSNFNKEQGQIHIGCRSKTPKDWLKYCNRIIELGLDKVTIEGYDFNMNEVKDFQKFITDNY